MSYQVLARKWRPANFHELVGQEHVKKALVTALDSGRLHHAFLFTGTRGVGKTTIARILAKCLNCEQGVTSRPCGECDACLAIQEGRFVDLVEVDAASRTKVDDTRELLENVQYRPTHGRYKVYLVDEVHMLSTHSFNALLKTLEEPPEHVVFLLATTDPEKLPVTVLSRCLQFHLRHMSEGEIASHLAVVLQQEGIAFDKDALALLAQAATGSMRDALSLLDQAIAHGGGEVRTDGVKAMLGYVERAPVCALLQAVAEGDGEQVFELARQWEQFSADFLPVLDAMLHVLHELALAQVVPGMADDLSQEERTLLQVLSPEDVQLFYDIALRGRQDLPLAPSSRMGFEMFLLRLLAFRPETGKPAGGGRQPVLPGKERAPSASVPQGEKPSPPTRAEASVSETGAPTLRVVNTPRPADVAEKTESETPEEGHRPAPSLDLAKVHADNWPDIAQALPLAGPTQQIVLNSLWLGQEDGRVRLLLRSLPRVILTEKRVEAIRQALEQLAGSPVSLDIQHEDDGARAAASETPRQRSERQRAERQAAAEAHVALHPFVKSVVQQFDGTIREHSVEPLEEGPEARRDHDSTRTRTGEH
jgi:DNA polymerase-3 subunit gamma/tau